MSEEPFSSLPAIDEATPHARPQLSPRAFWWLLAGICGLVLVLRLAMLDEFLRENPLAECPRVDAATYWDMAGRMASGQWISPTPFLSAPLYPYLLGVIRTFGGGLLAVYLMQLVMHLATGVVVAQVTRIRFGTLAGILAAAAFFALTEPAVSYMRILANTLQLLLVALMWWRWAVAAESIGRWRDILLTGALLGLFALAYPAAMLLIPAFGLWIGWQQRWRWPAVGKSLAGMAAALLFISPATLHNLLAHGEFIPITAHSGITLRQGNNPNAKGNITELPGISMTREQMHEDAARQFRQICGRDGSWREIDAHFRRQAIDFWIHQPLAALKLLGWKLYFFLIVRNYDDIMSVAIEREAGFADRAVLAPLATPWLFGFALVGLVALLRRPIRFAPEWLLALLPLLVVLLFFYSPRYRLPAVPVVCGLSAYALTNCRRFRVPTPIVVAAFFLPLPLYVWNRVQGIDAPERVREHMRRELSEAQTQAGDLRAATGQFAAAEQRYRSALELCDTNALAHLGLGNLYAGQRRLDDAIREFQDALRLDPTDQATYFRLYNALCIQQRYPQAADTLERVLLIAPHDPQALLALAWLRATCPLDTVRDGAAALRLAETAQALTTSRADTLDVLAAAHAELGQFDQAISIAEMAVAEARRSDRQQRAAAIEQHLAEYRAAKPVRAPPRMIRPQ